MKKILGAILVFVALVASSVMVSYEATNMCARPAFAKDGDVQASILGDCAKAANDKKWNGQDDEAAGIKCLLNLVLTILTYGIGILGVIGIMISGIQYITSSGDPAKMTKAKNRILQIVIGLIIYAVMWAALRFLVPGFSGSVSGF